MAKLKLSSPHEVLAHIMAVKDCSQRAQQDLADALKKEDKKRA